MVSASAGVPGDETKGGRVRTMNMTIFFEDHVRELQEWLEFQRKQTLRNGRTIPYADDTHLECLLVKGMKADAEWQKHKMIRDAQPFEPGEAVGR